MSRSDFDIVDHGKRMLELALGLPEQMTEAAANAREAGAGLAELRRGMRRRTADSVVVAGMGGSGTVSYTHLTLPTN